MSISFTMNYYDDPHGPAWSETEHASTIKKKNV
jgi:hypothetical protein